MIDYDLKSNMKGGEIMFKKASKWFAGAVGAGVAVVTAAGSAMALTTTELETEISGITSNVETIGLAILAVLAGLACINLLRRVIR